MTKAKSKTPPIKETSGRTAAAPKKPRAPAGAKSAPAVAAARPRDDDADAFIRSHGDQAPVRSSDDLAEVLGEDFLEAATRGNEVFEDELGRPLPDEVGGPFIVTQAGEELIDDIDESNPPDAEPAARPKAVAGLVQRPRAAAAAAEEEEEEEEDEDEDEDEDDEDEDEDEDEDDKDKDEEVEVGVGVGEELAVDDEEHDR